MNFEDCKTKIQKISSLLENSKYPEEILNSKEIDLENDFQYLCLNSTVNYDLVNEVIARLAQNGNKSIVENNIKSITINMWKELFKKNNATKEIFIKEYDKILESTGILTYREIENFIEDESTLPLIYGSIQLIVKKLCTYDRASLIYKLKNKSDGIKVIKDNMECFFKKGEFDISTTYSKILIELSKIPEITRIEILEACNKYLGEMLDRETAIDNETNDLLIWIYDSMEETQMYNEQRNMLQKNIDNAILQNFDTILDKSNYDKETIKILKQFSCTHNKFENNKNLFIEKSNKLIHMTKIYDLAYEKENKEKYIEKNKENNDNIVDFHNTKLQSDDTNKTNVKIEEINAKEHVDEDIQELTKFNELINKEQEKSVEQTSNIISSLVKDNIMETDIIVNRIIKKSVDWDYEDKTAKIENNEEEKHLQINSNSIHSIQCNNSPTSNNKEDEQKSLNMKSDISSNTSFSDNTALVLREEAIEIPKEESIFKRIWNKILFIFTRFKTDRIGE